ncbi:MAG: hypothetical protein ACE5EG_01575 [Thermoanaerobaculia bacterium]
MSVCSPCPWRGAIARSSWFRRGRPSTRRRGATSERPSGTERSTGNEPDTRINARRNGLEEIEIRALRAEPALAELPAACQRLLVDPPRKGLSREALEGVLALGPERLTYVSCDPPTLARDLRRLTEGYRVEGWTLLDMFPQTGHMEVVVQMVAAG